MSHFVYFWFWLDYHEDSEPIEGDNFGPRSDKRWCEAVAARNIMKSNNHHHQTCHLKCADLYSPNAIDFVADSFRFS